MANLRVRSTFEQCPERVQTFPRKRSLEHVLNPEKREGVAKLGKYQSHNESNNLKIVNPDHVHIVNGKAAESS